MKRLLKSMAPQFVLTWRKSRVRERNFLGPFESYDEALSHVQTYAFSGDVWAAHSASKLAPKTDDYVPAQHHVMLASMVAALSQPALKIVDWGGGVGESFDAVTAGKAPGAKLDYVVVDNGRLAAVGKKERPAIRFVDYREPEAFSQAADADILFMSSVLQYIPEWPSFLRRIVEECRPQFVLIARHLSPDALDRQTFATQAVYTRAGYAGEVAIQLIPVHSLIGEMEAHYRATLSLVREVPAYFPRRFDPLNVRERNILFCRKASH